MALTIFEPYQITHERGLRLWCELIVYLLQRKVYQCDQCAGRCKNVDEEKAINLVRHWPGSELTIKEQHVLHFLLGKAVMAHGFLSNMEEIMEIDLNMGAEYCIQKMEKTGQKIHEMLLTDHQKKWN